MELHKLVAVLDKEFGVKQVKDDWDWLFDDLFLKKSLPSFRKPTHHTGLCIKNADRVEKIYTAFAPSTYVLEEIARRGVKNTLLVVKHPFDWDGRRKGKGFIRLSKKDYDLMERMNVSLYSLHTPLDKDRNDSVVSTAYAFARVIGLNVTEEFAPEGERNPDLLIGVIGTAKDKTFDGLAARLSSTLGYKVKTLKVDDSVGKVAVATGGAFVPEIVQEAKDNGCSTYITGIITSNQSEYNKKHFAATLKAIKAIGINVIGCSHYLTEKWALEFSLPYFRQFCDAEYIEDRSAQKKLE